MHFRLLLLAVIFSFSLYLTLNIVVGPTGLVEYAKLQDHRRALEHHVENLERHQELLLLEAQELQQSAQRLLIESRQAGYYQEHEYIIRFTNREQRPYLISAGNRFSSSFEGSEHRPTIRLLALCCGFVFYFVALLLDKSSGTSARPSI